MSGADESLQSTGPTLSGSPTSETLEATTSQPSMFSPVDFPANPSVLRDRVSPRLTHDGSGRSTRASFAYFDRDSCSWRTLQDSLIADSETCSPIWPKAGMTRNGIAYLQPPLALLTRETESSLLPTPLAADARSASLLTDAMTFRITSTGRPRKVTAQGHDGSVGLTRLLKLLPTILSREWKDTGTLYRLASHDRFGDGVVRRISAYSPASLSQEQTAGLNPCFGEWMMGYPTAWSELPPSATP